MNYIKKQQEEAREKLYNEFGRITSITPNVSLAGDMEDFTDTLIAKVITDTERRCLKKKHEHCVRVYGEAVTDTKERERKMIARHLVEILNTAYCRDLPQTIAEYSDRLETLQPTHTAVKQDGVTWDDVTKNGV